jgi:uncharacterized protein YndB with AHSA1/START domain
MIRLEESRRYPVPRETAFDYITDPRNWPAYWPDLLGIADPEKARWKHPGDEMRLRMRLNGRPVDLHLTLQEYVVPSLVTYRSVQAGLPDVAHERHFLENGSASGFEYRLAVSYEPRGGLPGVVDRTLVRYGLRRALRRTLHNLEQRLHD